MLAIATPDTTDHVFRFETLNFWVEHYLLVAVPFLIVRSFDFSKVLTIEMAVTIWGLFLAYHCLVLFPLSLRSYANVNYVLKPPSGPLEMFGTYYRLPMTLFCLILTIGFNIYIIPQQAKLVRRYKKELRLKSE